MAPRHLKSAPTTLGLAFVLALAVGSCGSTDTEETVSEVVVPADMVVFEPGCFVMGSPDDEDHEGDPRERPLIPINHGRFAIDRHLVTAEQYAAFLQAHGNVCGHDGVRADCYDCADPDSQISCDSFDVFRMCQSEPDGPMTDSCAQHPAAEVTWYGARAYCLAQGKRLPTEAEWERAAKGPGGAQCDTYNKFPWGEDCSDEFRFRFFFGQYLLDCDGLPAWTQETTRANCTERECHDGFQRTSPVGFYESGATAEGVYDLAGNVSQWVEDDYFFGHDERPDDMSARYGSGLGKVRKGSSYYKPGRVLRGAYRNQDKAWNAWEFVGFRCAVSL